MPTERRKSPERVMSSRDWAALYIAHRLGEQVILHGADALETFIDAMVELRAARSLPDSEDAKR